ncbi:double-strand-break repair protein rad21-like protein 1 isoform X2 [Neolamprologus brichardi]|uniref:double-strand-break repair protein rad21-like protein 1 isoform X2 n=1 Tax=Neolamprologus brichardi TaxID=32507 RepID=UPI0003EC4EAA|nr:double-strand-break repair protein rad21-like protein 1 isoform X2 [Neolamprologus brichardi]
MLFYTQLFTSKRGSLAKIWLAAHWEKKLTKAHVFECNLETTIREIISPKVRIGLRSSGHLLLGVVRIYSRKAKYLLADCSDALIKIKTAFRPGHTDLPVEGLEATIKAITLVEDFTTFDPQLPDPSDIDVVDHFSLNQCRSEEITLKEDFGNNFLNFADIGDECQSYNALMDVSFQSLAQHGDAFGDEDRGFDLLDFLAQSSDNAEATEFIQENPQNENLPSSPLYDQREPICLADANRTDSMEVETPMANQTTLLANEEAFALEPVPITPNSERKKGKRKRKLVVDQTKELSNECIRKQLSDFSDLVTPLDMAPPTVQLMQWKESGGADKLFAQPCSTVLSLQIKELFARSFFQVKRRGVREDVEEMRHKEHKAQRELSALTTEVSVMDLSADPEKTHNTELTEHDHVNDSQRESYSQLTQDENRSELNHPSLPSEDSIFVHPPYLEHSTQSTSRHTQQSQHDSKDPTFSLQGICEGSNRWQAATTFFCFLVLKKQEVLRLCQTAPYEDISATPGPKFYN